ncbi:MAG: type II/IV secretion system protein [Planctomycetes bacterium]|nr:type II/IV secretion system protein [Planctomycetota bacterium]
MRKKIGELLCSKSYLGEADLQTALFRQQDDQRKIGEILLDSGFISQSQISETLASQAGIDKAELDDITIPQEVLAAIPAEMVSKYNVLPIGRTNGRLDIAMVDPFQRQAIESLRLVTGCSIRRYYGSPIEMERAIMKFYGSKVTRMLDDLSPTEMPAENIANGGDEDFSAARLHELATEPSLINLVNLVLLEAIEARASDIHIEPFEKQVNIKYRIDGMLSEKSSSPKKLQAAITSRIKIMAGMNIAERFVPQDGHIEFKGRTSKVDIRVSTVPTVFGESITMRILDRSAALISLEDLGMNELALTGFSQCLAKAHGIVLVTGPTGSGKTTTLYAALNKIYSPTVKIITIEDPVEYQLEGIIQMPVNPKRGLTFSKGLRHILRQDPNIIMVGEIRDKETADIAIRAALTGHLVFSTLHTNDSAGAVTRLIDMGVEPFLLASSLEGVIAQRLVRTICPACKTEYTPDENLLRGLDNSVMIPRDIKFYKGTGCNECNKSGMKGRVGIFELLRVTDKLRKLIATSPTTEQILTEAPSDYVSMRHDGIDKICKGVTSCEEILRVTKGIDDE